MASGSNDNGAKFTFRRYQEGDSAFQSWDEKVHQADMSYNCPVYVQRTPPCQGSCPSGEDIRGWLDIVRGVEKPAKDQSWQEYAFRRSTASNPFPAVIGRVCPAPCQDGCNRNDLDDHVGINSIEQFLGDQALAAGWQFEPAPAASGKRVALIGGGPASLSCAYQLRKLGHACTLFEAHERLGGMIRYGIPGYRTPRAILDGEIQRILDLGVEVRTNTRVGRDIGLDELERDFDAVFIGIGAQKGNRLPIPGGDAPNVIDAVSFLRAFNDGRLKVGAGRVVVIGAGDTAMDVVSVARRLGHIRNSHEKDRVENVTLGYSAHDVAETALREGAEVTLAYRRPLDQAPAAQEEIDAARAEGVVMKFSVAPVEVVLDDAGRARALKVVEVDWIDGKMVEKAGSGYEIPCDILVPALGQSGDLAGFEGLDNGRGQIAADRHYQVTGRPGLFVAGDILRPHLMTTAIGQGAKAARSIHAYLMRDGLRKPPQVDVHHFNLLGKLEEAGLAPEPYTHGQTWGTSELSFAVHNFEDRSANEIIPVTDLFLGYFERLPRHSRRRVDVNADNVLGHTGERVIPLSEPEVVAEAKRCLSCGMCFECDNCVIYCPQDAVKRVPKNQATTGRYVYTDYSRCVGCYICSDVCPTGYIQMGMGA